jgi:catechol 2,3-dioxygenase-like lactoylglutathione lyase family enzyme
VSGPGLGAFSHVTVGVAALDAALGFWSRNFGLHVRDRREGPDAALARIWGIDPGRITRQALVATPLVTGSTVTGRWASAGNLHLVEFAAPLPPVRRGARAWDRLPKNLDLYTVDMATRYAELKAAGHEFRATWGEFPAGGHVFREVHLPGHDGINVVLLEVIGPGYATPMSPRGYAGIGPLVTIVGDGAAEARFYRDVLGMATTLELLLNGPAIEQTVGLPPGAGLDIRVFGAADEPLGRVEVIEYQRVQGDDLYPRANPPATGILHLNYRVPDLAPIRARLAQAGVPVTEHGNVTALFGSGPVISFRSPAGFRIEVQE